MYFLHLLSLSPFLHFFLFASQLHLSDSLHVSLSLFCPQENTEEALLLLLISESMVRPNTQWEIFHTPL